jgi:UDP-glucose 4-epimerase
MNNIWITGAYGFIGRHLALELSRQGNTVSGLGHGVWPEQLSLNWGVSVWINGDIHYGNLQLLKQISCPPKTIYHLAGGSSVGISILNPRDDFDRTLGGTIELLEWVRQESPTTKVVSISSAAVYGGGLTGPISEDSKLLPHSPYGHHKMMMEALCGSYGKTYGLNSLVARLFSVYGPGLKKQLLWDLCSKLQKNPFSIELSGTGEELRDWVDVRDIVRALIMLSGHADPTVPIFNVGSGIPTSVRDVAKCVLSAWSEAKDTQLIFNGESRVGDPFSLYANKDKLVKLGFEFTVTPPEGILSYVNWFRRHSVIK